MRALFTIFLLALGTGAARASEPALSAGETMYRQGVLPSGAALLGVHTASGPVEGAAAACVNCHRRSGLGTTEGRFVIPPITRRYLFRPNGNHLEDVDFRYGAAFTPNLDSYSDATLARALREGIGRDGHQLNDLMPRFQLDDEAMTLLTRYLKQLSSGTVPGVGTDILHFATIITPDADPVKRQGMLNVLERFFGDKNEFIRGGTHPMRTSKSVTYRVTRKWQLHVWELNGPPDTWEDQLHERLVEEPVFAIVSGIGGKTWTPIHRFCEREAVPCILPNVDLPTVSERDFYTIYFSEQVLLESKLIAHQLQQERGKSGLRRVIQVFREDDVGKEAAEALTVAMAGTLPVANRALASGSSPQAASHALHDAEPGDAIVLWLRPKDLQSLPAGIKSKAVFVSGLMGGLEQMKLPPAWRKSARIAYPFDLPEQRMVRMNFPLGWFKIRHIPILDERVQTDTYLACRVLAESMGDMLETFVRDYLVEQIENMLSKRLVNGYYPRLSLAPGQRFASKGGYLVRFLRENGPELVVDGAWVVP